MKTSEKAQRYTLLAVGSAISAVLWSLIGFLVTGRNAYVDTHGAFFGGGQVFLSWLSPATLLPSSAYPLTPGAILAFFLTWALFQAIYNGANAYPPILRMWPVVLAAYIFTFTTPIGNEIRYLLLGLFMVPFTRIPESKLGRAFYFLFMFALLLVAIYAQWKWVSIHWVSVEGQLRKNV